MGVKQKKKKKITTKKNRTTLPSKTVAVAVHSSCAWCVVCGARMHGVLVRGATSLVRGVGVFVALEFVVIVVALEFLWCRWSHWSLRVVVHACAANPLLYAKIGFGSGRVSPTRPNLCYENFNKKKKLSSAIIAIPPRSLRLWRPQWRRHMKPAMPSLFGGIFPKTRNVIPSWHRHNHNLTTL